MKIESFRNENLNENCFLVLESAIQIVGLVGELVEWLVGGWSPLHNHTTSWLNLQVEDLQELKTSWIPSWARVWQYCQPCFHSREGTLMKVCHFWHYQFKFRPWWLSRIRETTVNTKMKKTQHFNDYRFLILKKKQKATAWHNLTSTGSVQTLRSNWDLHCLISYFRKYEYPGNT